MKFYESFRYYLLLIVCGEMTIAAKCMVIKRLSFWLQDSASKISVEELLKITEMVQW